MMVIVKGQCSPRTLEYKLSEDPQGDLIPREIQVVFRECDNSRKLLSIWVVHDLPPGLFQARVPHLQVPHEICGVEGLGWNVRKYQMRAATSSWARRHHGTKSAARLRSFRKGYALQRQTNRANGSPRIAYTCDCVPASPAADVCVSTPLAFQQTGLSTGNRSLLWKIRRSRIPALFVIPLESAGTARIGYTGASARSGFYARYPSLEIPVKA